MSNDNILYKYSPFNEKSLSMLINREFYFAKPSELNDPYDCNISISEAVQAAINQAGVIMKKPVKLKKKWLTRLKRESPEIELEIRNCGILSLSRKNDDMQMWTHYADEHKGLCFGFVLSDKFKKYNEEHGILFGGSPVVYKPENPFFDFLKNFSLDADEPREWEIFWLAIFKVGLTRKSKSWSYEDEIRVIREKSGTVPFSSKELVEVIFGLNMDNSHKKTIKQLLSGEGWNHVRYREMIKKDQGFELELRDE